MRSKTGLSHRGIVLWLSKKDVLHVQHVFLCENVFQEMAFTIGVNEEKSTKST